MPISHDSVPLKALLVAVQLPQVSDKEVLDSLNELSRLVKTLGYEVVGQLSQKRNSEKSGHVVGDGKLREIAKWTGGSGKVAPMVEKKKHKAALKFNTQNEVENTEINTDQNEFAGDEPNTSEASIGSAQVVIFDCDLSPSQLRNLESATGVTVLDRTGVIIEIFSRHARTKAAQLQVEIARLTYVAPRLRETGGNEVQQGGGGKGSGETSIELDRRKIRDRIKELKEQLSAIADEQNHRRARRQLELTVALVGYTNAGKSSLMRALTGSEVLIADQLFATLDTTVRSLYPETLPRILISDTVGFIKKLPHDLVASFKSTLDEALNASLLLYVVDSSDAGFRSQLQVTQDVLSEVGVDDVEKLLVLNKTDCLPADELTTLKNEFPNAVFLSAKNKDDVAALRLRLLSFFESDMIDSQIEIPYTVQGVIGEIRSRMRVLSEDYRDNGVIFVVRATPETIQQMAHKFKLKTNPLK